MASHEDDRKYLSALPKAMDAVSGIPSRKSAKSLPVPATGTPFITCSVAAPVKVKLPRASCCDRWLNCCRRETGSEFEGMGLAHRRAGIRDAACLVTRERLLRIGKPSDAVREVKAWWPPVSRILIVSRNPSLSRDVQPVREIGRQPYGRPAVLDFEIHVQARRGYASQASACVDARSCRSYR